MSKAKGRRQFLFGILFLFLAIAIAGSGGQAHAGTANTTKAEVLSGGRWVSKNGKVRYKKKSGGYAKYGFKKIGGKWFYLDKKGYVITGLRKLNGQYYYFQDSGEPGVIGRMRTGMITINGRKYYFMKTGGVGVKGSRLESAWKTVKGVKYYFRKDGTLYDGETLTEQQFIQKVGALAKADMKRSGILASVTIAQAILESDFGRSSLGMEANNLFGMKANLSNNNWKSSWDGKTFTKKTLEYVNGKYVTVSAEFRAYSGYEESVRDHSNYLAYAKKDSKTLRYKGVVNNKNYKKTIQIIKNGGYATAPNYVSAVVNVIKKYKLTKYDK